MWYLPEGSVHVLLIGRPWVTHYSPQETQTRQYFRGLSQNEVPTVSPWLVSRAVLQRPDLTGLASYLAASLPSPGSPTQKRGGEVG